MGYSHFFSFPRSYPEEIGPKHWPSSRFTHVMKLRQAALRTAREKWSDYILVSTTFELLPGLRKKLSRGLLGYWGLSESFLSI